MKMTSEVVHKVWDSWNFFKLATVHSHENMSIKIMLIFCAIQHEINPLDA